MIESVSLTHKGRAVVRYCDAFGVDLVRALELADEDAGMICGQTPPPDSEVWTQLPASDDAETL